MMGMGGTGFNQLGFAPFLANQQTTGTVPEFFLRNLNIAFCCRHEGQSFASGWRVSGGKNPPIGSHQLSVVKSPQLARIPRFDAFAGDSTLRMAVRRGQDTL
jgi:hypothetical protein